jgi:cytohesin
MKLTIFIAVLFVELLIVRGVDATEAVTANDLPERTSAREATWTPKDTKRWRQFSKLLKAVDRGDLKAVKALIRQGVDVDGRNAGDDMSPAVRPLARAASRGFVQIVEVLLKAGAQPDWCCCSCVTALHEAINNKHVEIVRILLKAGASPTLLYDGETTPLKLAEKAGDERIG